MYDFEEDSGKPRKMLQTVRDPAMVYVGSMPGLAAMDTPHASANLRALRGLRGCIWRCTMMGGLAVF